MDNYAQVNVRLKINFEKRKKETQNNNNNNNNKCNKCIITWQCMLVQISAWHHSAIEIIVLPWSYWSDLNRKTEDLVGKSTEFSVRKELQQFEFWIPLMQFGFLFPWGQLSQPERGSHTPGPHEVQSEEQQNHSQSVKQKYHNISKGSVQKSLPYITLNMFQESYLFISSDTYFTTSTV